MTADSVLRLRNVSRSFTTPAGPVDVLKHINLNISRGEFLVLTGPSGSGKSTLLHICAMIDQPSEGNVELQGRDVSQASELTLCDIRKQSIGIVFQRFCLLPHRSALENVLFRFRYLDPPPFDALEKTRTVMKEMGITGIAERQARLLSSGEQQRVAIARAVVQEPIILLADEPTGNLDSESAASVMECFEVLHRKGLTIIMVTHNEALLTFATRHLICRDGSIEEGPLP